MSAADNTMRAEFEAWAMRVNSSRTLSDFVKFDDGTYVDRYLEGTTFYIFSQAWQAARAGTARMVAEQTRLYMQALDEEVAAAVAAEREACAAICDKRANERAETGNVREHSAYRNAAAAIRARSTTPDAGEQR